MKKFVTLFEKAENIHLIKDVGQIPYLMHSYFSFDATLVTYKNSQSYDYLNDEVQGLKIGFIPKLKLGRYSLSMLWYLFWNAKEIDVLHMFHHREKTYLNFLMYKWRNPNGVAFLKSDIGLNTIKEHNALVSSIRPKYRFRAWLFEKALNSLDIVSVESQEGYEIVQKEYSEHREKFLYMPNGINIDKMHKIQKPFDFSEKENIILTVGRIGAWEKNNEMLLKSIEKIDLQDFKVVFIGPIEESFQATVDEFYQVNPSLKERVIFTGAIYDRAELYKWYARSKIFSLTSKEESFGFVLIEAMAYGNYIVTTPISSAIEITQNEKYGEIKSSLDEYAKALQELISDETKLKNSYEGIIKSAQKNYSWSNLLTSLNERISKKF